MSPGPASQKSQSSQRSQGPQFPGEQFPGEQFPGDSGDGFPHDGFPHDGFPGDEFSGSQPPGGPAPDDRPRPPRRRGPKRGTPRRRPLQRRWLIGGAAVAVCLVIVIALVVTSSGSSAPDSAAGQEPSATAVPPVPPGFTQVFLDNFTGSQGAPPSAQNWLYDMGTDWGNKQVEQDTNSTSNIYLDGQGNLVIQANKDSKGQWTSGRIESTRGDFTAPPGGKVEMTALLQQPNVPHALGYWPAFWALGSSIRTGGEWPEIGELDMIEDVNGRDAAVQTLHYTGGAPHTSWTACPDTSSTCQTGFHSYSVIIDRTNPSAESLQYLMDGKVEVTYTEAQVGAAPWQAAIDHGFFLLLNLAIGGSYPDGDCHCTTPTADTTSGGALKVAWVAVYEQGGDSTPTATATATGQVTNAQGPCLSNSGAVNSYPNGTQLSSCQNADGQVWSTYSDGTIRTQGGCLDLANGHQSAGTAAVWYPCTQQQSQAWQPKPNGELLNSASGLCLTAPDSADGTPLEIDPCSGAPQQQWHLPA